MKKTVKITHIPKGNQPIRFPADVKYLEIKDGESEQDAASKWAEENKVQVVAVEVL